RLEEATLDREVARDAVEEALRPLGLLELHVGEGAAEVLLVLSEHLERIAVERLYVVGAQDEVELVLEDVLLRVGSQVALVHDAVSVHDEDDRAPGRSNPHVPGPALARVLLGPERL